MMESLLVRIDYNDESTIPEEGKEIEFFAPIYGENVEEARFTGFMKRSFLNCPQFFTKGLDGDYNVRIYNVSAWRYMDGENYENKEKTFKPCD